MSNALLFDPNSSEHDVYVCQKTADMIANHFFTYEQFHCDRIRTIDARSFDEKRLETLCIHTSPIKNRISIADSGIQAQIGVNSVDIEYHKAIHFNYGIEGFLAYTDVELKLNYVMLYSPANRDLVRNNPMPSGSNREIGKLFLTWRDFLISGEYKNDKDKLARVYHYQKENMIRKDVYSLYLIPDIDFSFDELDEKKKDYDGKDEYCREIFGEGFETRLNNPRVDARDMSTPLGADFVVSPDNLVRITSPDGDNSHELLCYFYDRYQELCKKESRRAMKFSLLDDFVLKTR